MKGLLSSEPSRLTSGATRRTWSDVSARAWCDGSVVLVNSATDQRGVVDLAAVVRVVFVEPGFARVRRVGVGQP